MAYPSRPLRKTSFSQQESQGNDLNTATLDAELNQLVACFDQLASRLESLTTPAGLLKGVSAATAMSLVGVQVFTATAAQTVFTTTIPWDTAFTNLNVSVVSQGLKLNPSTVTVANASGFLRVTIPAQTLNNIVQVLAYTAGAGVLSRLASQSAGDGATLVAIRDIGGYWTSAEVESALQEVGLRVTTLEAGDNTRWKKDGSNGPATGNWNLGNHQIKGLAPGTLNTDAVNLAQLTTITNEVSAVLRGACTVYGFKMQGGIDMDGNAIENLPAPLANGDAANKKYVDDTVAGAVPVLTGYMKRDGSTAPTADMNWGGFKLSALGNGLTGGDAVNLNQLNTVAAACLARDGSNSPSANMNWGGFRLGALGDGITGGDAVNLNQLNTVETSRLARDGSNSPSVNINWGGHKITNLAAGSDPTDAATVGQLPSSGMLIAHGMLMMGAAAYPLNGFTIGSVTNVYGTFPTLVATKPGLAIVSAHFDRVDNTTVSTDAYILIMKNTEIWCTSIIAAGPDVAPESLNTQFPVSIGDQIILAYTGLSVVDGPRLLVAQFSNI
jgi:hypothetical protein